MRGNEEVKTDFDFSAQRVDFDRDILDGPFIISVGEPSEFDLLIPPPSSHQHLLIG